MQAVLDGAARYFAHGLADGVEGKAVENIENFLLRFELRSILSFACQLNPVTNKVVGIGAKCGKCYSDISEQQREDDYR